VESKEYGNTRQSRIVTPLEKEELIFQAVLVNMRDESVDQVRTFLIAYDESCGGRGFCQNCAILYKEGRRQTIPCGSEPLLKKNSPQPFVKNLAQGVPDRPRGLSCADCSDKRPNN
jgi:hypothetical protein